MTVAFCAEEAARGDRSGSRFEVRKSVRIEER